MTKVSEKMTRENMSSIEVNSMSKNGKRVMDFGGQDSERKLVLLFGNRNPKTPKVTKDIPIVKNKSAIYITKNMLQLAL